MSRHSTDQPPPSRWVNGAVTRRTVAKGLALAGTGMALRALAQRTDGPVRIGYAIARTGPWAAGAQVSQEPNYVLWAEQVNAAGGLSVKGKKRRVDLMGQDDQSDIEVCTRSYEKLMGGEQALQTNSNHENTAAHRSDARWLLQRGDPCARPRRGFAALPP